MTNKFEPPPKQYTFWAVLAGIATAVMMIWGLNSLSQYLRNQTTVTPTSKEVSTDVFS